MDAFAHIQVAAQKQHTPQLYCPDSVSELVQLLTARVSGLARMLRYNINGYLPPVHGACRTAVKPPNSACTVLHGAWQIANGKACRLHPRQQHGSWCSMLMWCHCMLAHLLCVVALVYDLLDCHILPFKQAPTAAVTSRTIVKPCHLQLRATDTAEHSTQHTALTVLALHTPTSYLLLVKTARLCLSVKLLLSLGQTWSNCRTCTLVQTSLLHTASPYGCLQPAAESNFLQ
jgi:hypothetical protein